MCTSTHSRQHSPTPRSLSPTWPCLYSVPASKLSIVMRWPRSQTLSEAFLCFSGLFFRQITFLQWLEWSNINNFTNTAEETPWEAGKSSCGQQAFELILPINTCPEPHKHPDRAKRCSTLVPRAGKWENSDPLSSSNLFASTLQTKTATTKKNSK